MKKIISFTLLIIILTLLIQTPIKSNFQSNNITSQEKELTLTITDIKRDTEVTYTAEYVDGKQIIFTQDQTTDKLQKGDIVTAYFQHNNDLITVIKE